MIRRLGTNPRTWALDLASDYPDLDLGDVFQLSESEITSIDASGTTASGGFEDVFERKGIPGHLMKPYQDLGGRDGAWANLCERITTAAPLRRDAKAQEMLNAAIEWGEYNPELKWGIAIKDGSTHQVPLELAVDLVLNHRVKVGPHRFISPQPNERRRASNPSTPPSISVPLFFMHVRVVAFITATHYVLLASLMYQCRWRLLGCSMMPP